MLASTLCALSATDIASQTNKGELRCEEVARACLARIEAREPIVKAWSFIDHDLIYGTLRPWTQERTKHRFVAYRSA